MSYSRSKVQEPNPSEIFLFSVNATSNDVVYAFTDKGNLFRMVMDSIPEARGAGQGGVTFDSLFKEALKGETPVCFMNFNGKEPSGKVIFYTQGGMVKITDFADMSFSRSSCQVFKLKDGDSVLAVEQDIENKDIIFVTEKGMCLRADKKVPVQGRTAGGVIGIALDNNDKVIYASQIDDDTNTELYVITSFGTFKKFYSGLVRKTARAGKGVKISDLGDEKLNECVVYSKCLKVGEEVLFTVVDRIGTVYHVPSTLVKEDGRANKGKEIPSIGCSQPLNVYSVRQ